MIEYTYKYESLGSRALALPFERARYFAAYVVIRLFPDSAVTF